MRKHITALVLVGAALAVSSPAQANYYPQPPRSLEQAIHAVFKGQGEQTAACLAWAESKYNTERDVNGSSWSSSGDHGEWQINYLAHHRAGENEETFHARMANLLTNAHMAWQLSGHGHYWSAWTGTYGRGLCHGLN